MMVTLTLCAPGRTKQSPRPSPPGIEQLLQVRMGHHGGGSSRIFPPNIRLTCAYHRS